MEAIARATAGEVTRGRRTRFLASSRRFIVGASRWGGRKTGPNPTDRSRPGSKHHILVDANGVPISAILTGANRNDVTQLLPLVDAIPPIRGVRGRPLQKPKAIYADRGYDSEPHRQRLRERSIKPVIARRRTEHGSGLGKFRWVVERTHAWLHNFRRLRIRFERRADIHEAFLKLGCSLVCWNIFRRAEPSLAGKRAASPPPPPQRTVRAIFTAYGSSTA
ncbi:IS5 family transposase [Cupriavidus necator]|uniref:IS5 family transposase n=1 Tax=Cupriavidus necator TaxID=106590 RepID=UPI003B8A8CC3